MSDMKKALDAYRKASGEKSEPVSAEKYVFRPFVKETEKDRPGKQSGKVPGKVSAGKESATLDGKTGGKGAGQGERISDRASSVSEDGERPKGFVKIAKALLLLGQAEAASVLKHFSPDEIEKIASEMIRIKSIDKTEAAGLLKEIDRKARIRETFSGGVDTARKMLQLAFGEEAGEKILSRALPETRDKPFEFLQDIEPLQIRLALKGEPLTMIALVMNYLDPQKSAALLREYTAEEQKAIILRMASGGKIQRDVFERMEQVIKEKVRTQGHIVTQRIDGRSRLANILKFMDMDDEEEIIRDISDYDPELSQEISEQVYTIEIVHDIPDRYFQKVLNDFSDRELAVILKGRDQEIKQRFFSSLSQTRRELVKQESDYLGIMRKSEVNIATREFIDYIRQAEKDGSIIINRRGDMVL